MSETWLPVPGSNGLYDVSDQGRVRSWRSKGCRGEKRLVEAHILTPWPNKGSYPKVALYEGSTPGVRIQRRMFVHQLVLLAFVGPRPAWAECVRHLDGNPSNNHLSNLAYGTYSENMADTVRHGHNVNANKTHCIHGHEFTPENTIAKTHGGRQCRTCNIAGASRRRAAARAVA